MNRSVSIAAQPPLGFSGPVQVHLGSSSSLTSAPLPWFASLLLAGLILTLAGCSSDGATFGNIHAAPAVGVYVIQNNAASGSTAASGEILQFSTSSSGATAPLSTINNSKTTSLAYLAVDGYGDIYTSANEGSSGSAILEFPVGSSNNAQPIGDIPFNSTTGLTGINGLAVDGAGDIYAAGAGYGVAGFGYSQNGSVAPDILLPLGTQAADLTTLELPYAPAVDPKGNLYVADSASPAISAPAPTAPVVVFAPGATGSVAPARTLSGALTTLSFGTPQGMATDFAGNLYVTNVVSGVSSILIFAPGATGNTPPLRDITGSNTQLGCVGGIALDNEGYLYVVSTATCGSTANPTVLKFSTTGDGNIAPVATFTSTAWTNADANLSIAVY
ncbi:MAG: hypothetical protein ACLGQX_00090 [Acidobacteriota bacterium]